MRRCIREYEKKNVLRKCHDNPYGGHHASDRTVHKVFNQVFTGQLSLNKLEIFSCLVISVKGLVTLLEEMRYL